jgi:hypothetical protein
MYFSRQVVQGGKQRQGTRRRPPQRHSTPMGFFAQVGNCKLTVTNGDIATAKVK